MSKTKFIEEVKRINGDLYIDTLSYNVKKRRFNDSRNIKVNANTYKVHVVAEVKSKKGGIVYIACPYCGRIHTHGMNQIETERVPHCKDKELKDHKNYYIKY